MGTWRKHQKHLENSIFQSSSSQLSESSSFKEDAEIVRGRDIEARGRFPDQVSAFAERQKSHSESGARTTQ